MNDCLPLKLSRRIPARTLTLKARWCKKEWLPMSNQFRVIRSGCGNPMDRCYWCRHDFEDGEMMALAAFEGKLNKTLCQACADKLLTSAIAKAEATP